MKRHGMSQTAEYRAWRNMICLCGCKTHPRYHRYGGRGIGVCDRWAKSFDAFLADVGHRPDSAYWFMRLDADKDYEPGNCGWMPRDRGMWKRGGPCAIKMIQYEGVEMPRSRMAELHGINRATFRYRLLRGWDVKRAIETPV